MWGPQWGVVHKNSAVMHSKLQSMKRGKKKTLSIIIFWIGFFTSWTFCPLKPSTNITCNNNNNNNENMIQSALNDSFLILYTSPKSQNVPVSPLHRSLWGRLSLWLQPASLDHSGSGSSARHTPEEPKGFRSQGSQWWEPGTAKDIILQHYSEPKHAF